MIALRRILIQLVVSKFFSLNIVIANARGIEQVGHRGDHSRRARDVVDRSFQPEEITREHLTIDVTLFIGPSNGSMSSDRWNEGEIWILRGQTLKFFEERRVVRLPVRIEQIEFVRQTFLGSLINDAANGRNPGRNLNSASDDRGARQFDIVIEVEPTTSLSRDHRAPGIHSRHAPLRDQHIARAARSRSSVSRAADVGSGGAFAAAGRGDLRFRSACQSLR